jgi:hypothetical protein
LTSRKAAAVAVVVVVAAAVVVVVAVAVAVAKARAGARLVRVAAVHASRFRGRACNAMTTACPTECRVRSVYDAIKGIADLERMFSCSRLTSRRCVRVSAAAVRRTVVLARMPTG